MKDDSIKVTATCVRVPIFDSHSESINVEFEKPYELSDVFTLFNEMDGIIVQDDPTNNLYPLADTAAGLDEVFVGRIRRDESLDNGLNFWCVADNIRKGGAATNAVQIAEVLAEKM